ncbi:MAG: DUF6782 family putative metallopeptidase [Alphaproteobacteria bacterium]
MAEPQDAQAPAQPSAQQPTHEQILRALRLWDDTKTEADNVAAARAQGLGDWLDKPQQTLEQLEKAGAALGAQRTLIEKLNEFSEKVVNQILTAAAIVVPAVLLAEGYKRGLVTPQMAKIAIENPAVLVSSLDWVQKMRIASAISTIAETSEGARLVGALRDSGLSVDMTLNPGNIGGAVQHRTVVEAGNIDTRASEIAASGFSTKGGLTAVLAHELRHLEQSRSGEIKPSRGGLVSPESEVIYNRFIEADAQATATGIAWELKQKGNASAWEWLKRDEKWFNDIAKAYEAVAEADPSAVADGRAKRAAFDAWFTAEVKPGGVKIADVYNRQGILNLPQTSTLEEAIAQGARPTGDMTAEQYARAGGNNGDNYLTRTGGRPLDDPYYRMAHFDYNETQTLRMQNEHYQSLQERFNPVAAPPPPAPPAARPSLTNADVQFILEGDYALRHVSSGSHMNEHFTGTVYGDAVPLTGMGRIILDQMADEGLIPSRRSTTIADLMAKHGDAIRARFETALADNIAGSVKTDGAGTSHFMIVKGMENAVESSYLDDPAYPFGKAGKQTIRPGQIISSAAIEQGDLGRIARGGTITDILHDKVVESLHGISTGDQSLVSDLRQRGGGGTLPNSMIDPGDVAPAVRDWTLEVLRARGGEVDATKLNALAEAAQAADPPGALRAASMIAQMERGSMPQPVLESMPRWVETALAAAEKTDPAGAFFAAQSIGDKLPPGDPMHSVTNKAIATAARNLAAVDPQSALTKVAIMAERLPAGDPRSKMVLELFSDVYETARRADPEAAAYSIESQRPHVKTESDFGKMLAEKSAQAKLPAAPVETTPVADVEAKPVTETKTTTAADVEPRQAPEIEARPIPAGLSTMAKINNAVDGGMGAVGLVQGTMGAISSYQKEDYVGVVVNGANAASGGASVGISIARGLGHEIAPALGTAVTKANVVLTVGTGLYQIATEKGNFIDTEADGSHNLGNKGERTVAVVATGVAGVGLVAAGVGTAGVVPAVVAVAVVGDKVIEARRAWKDVDRQIAENGAAGRRDVTLSDGDGSPDVRKFRHIIPEMIEVSKDIRDSELPFKPQRDPQTGRIKMADMRRLALGEDPKFLAEFERALNANIQRQQKIMTDNDSVLPKWMRLGDSVSKYTTAQMILADMQGAKTELGWFRTDQAAWDAQHNPVASRFTGPQQQTPAERNEPAPATRIATTPPPPRA